jgi:hypothetical protein
MVKLQLLAIGEKVMENGKKQIVKNAFKKLWTKVKPFLPAITLVSVIIAAVIVLTYFYFACSFGFIPSDRIVDENAIKKSDWLMFWGSILAVICTLSLALVSFQQNNDLHKTNDDREKKDTFFAKMRFAAEFYSLIDFKSVIVKEGKNKLVTLTFNIKDVGKIPANTAKFSIIEIKPIESIEQTFRLASIDLHLFTLRDKNSDIRNNQHGGTSIDETPRRTISFDVDLDQYDNLKRMYAEIFELGRRDQQTDIWGNPSFRLEMIYSLENPLGVKTEVISEILLETDFTLYTPNEEKKYYKFTIKEKVDKKISYDFVREIK